MADPPPNKGKKEKKHNPLRHFSPSFLNHSDRNNTTSTKRPKAPLRSSLKRKLSPSSSSSNPNNNKEKEKEIEKRVHFTDDLSPSSIKLKIVCGPRHDPSLIVYIKMRFHSDGGGRPRLGFKIRHPREEREERIEKEEKRVWDQRVWYGDGSGADGDGRRTRGRNAGREGEGRVGDVGGEGEWFRDGRESKTAREKGKDMGRERRDGKGGDEGKRGRAAYKAEERWPGPSGQDKPRSSGEAAEKVDAEESTTPGFVERGRRRY